MEKAKKGLTLDTFLEYCLIMLLITAIAYIGNWIYSDFGLMESLPGILILLAIAFVGYTLSELIPFNIPSVVYISIVGLLVAMPVSPLSEAVVAYTGKVEMLPLATPVLAFAGVSMGKSWAEFKKIGWRGILVAALVMIGTFVGSAVVAQVILSMTGII
ncbi:hypothetical protein C3B58_18405 [Lactonifactor longoviformis]|uniref:DUF340 domain-containing protein n=1 Tax=Lactonifactor longoviformis DSM 17459 TaxID=1122155 RepID=A0A1M5CEU0_9CLOT|nr:hypothetical protein [Lactonifactor longoviformis]POP31012.1 hypothetical protein C3B58_18405 [Lactonifactor longoviformis]SHF53263.1 hypothetical protein SAMN02745158_04118 [Lactonifactor longoviformis DSM 17459]